MTTRPTVLIGAFMAFVCNVSSVSAATTADPCSLVTDTDVSTALGVPVTKAKLGSDATHCHWEQQGKRGTTVVDAHLLVESASTYDAAKGAMGASGLVTKVPLKDLGDDAYYLVSKRDAPLFVKKGTSAIRVAVDGKGWTADEIKTKEKALASVVLSKL